MLNASFWFYKVKNQNWFSRILDPRMEELIDKMLKLNYSQKDLIGLKGQFGLTD